MSKNILYLRLETVWKSISYNPRHKVSQNVTLRRILRDTPLPLDGELRPRPHLPAHMSQYFAKVGFFEINR